MAAIKRPSRAVWIAPFAVALVIGGSLWAYFGRGPTDEDPSALPEGLTTEAIKAKMDDPAAMRDTMRDVMRRDDLTDEQRREAMRNVREAGRSAMQARVDEYLNAPEDQKQAILDRQIDEFVERMKEWRSDQENREEPSEEQRERFRQLFRSRSQQERKAQSESRNPDQMARTMAYFSAARARMQERGIEMPRGPRGRGGPGGPGGRGGRGGGRRRP